MKLPKFKVGDKFIEDFIEEEIEDSYYPPKTYEILYVSTIVSKDNNYGYFLKETDTEGNIMFDYCYEGFLENYCKPIK